MNGFFILDENKSYFWYLHSKTLRSRRSDNASPFVPILQDFIIQIIQTNEGKYF